MTQSTDGLLTDKRLAEIREITRTVGKTQMNGGGRGEVECLHVYAALTGLLGDRDAQAQQLADSQHEATAHREALRQIFDEVDPCRDDGTTAQDMLIGTLEVIKACGEAMVGLADSQAQVAVQASLLAELWEYTEALEVSYSVWAHTRPSMAPWPKVADDLRSRLEANDADTAAAAEAYKRQLRLEGARELARRYGMYQHSPSWNVGSSAIIQDVLADMEREAGQ